METTPRRLVLAIREGRRAVDDERMIVGVQRPRSRQSAEVAGAVRPHLARHADSEQHAFTALNTAFLVDGAVVHVPAGSTVDRPIHILHVSMPGAEPQVSHPRGLIVVEAGGGVTVIESFVGDGAGSYLTNSVTEIVAADNTHVDH